MPTARAPVSQRSKRPVKGRAFPWKLLLLLAVAGVLFLFLRPYLLPSKALPAVLEEDWITVDLLPENPYSRPQIPLKQVNGVVVHYTGNPNTSAEANRSYFAGLAQSGATYASSHFIIGIDGKISASPSTRSPTAPTPATTTPSLSSAATRTSPASSPTPPISPW